MMISSGAPSFGGGSSFDTLDFSLPSYGQASKGDDQAAPTKAAPAFSFPELKIPGKEEVNAADEAAAKQAADDEKAAKAQVRIPPTSSSCSSLAHNTNFTR